MIQSYLRGYPAETLGTHPTSRTVPNWRAAIPPRNNGHTVPNPADQSAHAAAVRAYASQQLAALGPAAQHMFVQRNYAPPAAQPRSTATTVRTGPAAHAGSEYAGAAAYFGPGLNRAAIPPSFYMPYE